MTTLGGVDKNFIEVTVYTCFLVDVNSKTEGLEVYGMSTIMSCLLNFTTKYIWFKKKYIYAEVHICRGFISAI